MAAGRGRGAGAEPPVLREGMPLGDQVVDALRRWSVDNADVVQHLSRRLGVSVGDAEAFGQVLYAQERGTPLTPTLLGRRVGLSTGATTALLNRLEAAGLVARSRENRDRRVVTLRVPPEVAQDAGQFFAPLGERVDELARRHPPELLRQVVAVLDELHEATAEVVREFETTGPRAR